MSNVDDRVLRRRAIVGAAQPGIDVARRLLAVADRGRHRPLAGHHVAAGEDPGMAGHHVRADDHRAIGLEFDRRGSCAGSRCRSPGRAPARPRRRRASRSGRSAAAGRSASSSIISTVRSVPVDLLDARQPFDLDALLDRLLGLEGVGRHVRAIAAVDDERLFGAEAPGGPRGVHRRVAAAVDDDAAAQLRRLAASRRRAAALTASSTRDGVARRNVDVLCRRARRSPRNAASKRTRLHFGGEIVSTL